MARLIVIVPLLLLVGARLFTWWAKARTARLQAAAIAARPAPGPAVVPSEHGLLPAARLVVQDARGLPGTAEALAAARAGDWRPVADHLAAVGTAPDLLWYRMRPFSDLAAEDDTWLRAWRRERPEDPQAALLHAEALVVIAWTVRSGRRAQHVTREQADGFHRVLGEAEAAAREAAALADPADPNALVSLARIARGLNWDNERFRALWADIVARDPHHTGAHLQALQYWCAKWRGSHELMHAFADAAASAAPAGSLLTALRLEAYWEQYAGTPEAPQGYLRPELGAALDAALADLAAAPADHHRLADARGWAALLLHRHGRHAEAVEQFRALGASLPLPWSQYEKPLAAFTGDRAAAVLAAVRTAAPAVGPAVGTA
jgi:hypothetical protein